LKCFKLFRYYYSDLNGKSGRIEYAIYLLIEIIANFLVVYFYKKMNFNDKTVINLFYIWLILNFIFVPIHAVSTRRLKDIGINRTIIILNFIPIIKIFFSLFLLFKKAKTI
jgi:uncharacterized membrane protein YhaH (DUF805 family)